ncbi:MAG TPA: hypothetical protein VH877_11010 [Polyangia bacterium]|jgi:hypothetical protein|nr:hypothetical protein [Polyangia bacterium]
MKKPTEKQPQQVPTRLVLKKETLRKLRPEDLEAAAGGGDENIATSINK